MNDFNTEDISTMIAKLDPEGNLVFFDADKFIEQINLYNSGKRDIISSSAKLVQQILVKLHLFDIKRLHLIEWSKQDVFAEELMDYAKQQAAQIWCKEKTKHITMNPDLAEEFAKTIHEIWSSPWLENATTEELLLELKSRIDVNDNISSSSV